MSLIEVFTLTLLRSMIVAGAGLMLSGSLLGFVRHRERTRGGANLLLILLFVPLFIPELITGFIWRPVSAQLMGTSTDLPGSGWLPEFRTLRVLTFGDMITEVIYSLLLLIRVTAIGCAARWLLPASPVSAASLHAWKLLRYQVPVVRWQWNWLLLNFAGPWRVGIVAWSLMVLTGLQEFETAALMQLDHSPVVWTVTLFDAHAAHQPLADSLQMVTRPLLVQLLLLGPIFVLLLVSSRTKEIRSDEQSMQWSGSVGRLGLSTAIGWLAISLMVAVCWPIAGQMAAFVDAVILMLGNPAMFTQSLGQVAVSLGFALAAAVVSLRIAAFLLDTSGIRQLFWLILLPGLTGPLVSSLMVLAIFQWPQLRAFYDTWLPLLMGSVLSVLPRAVLVVVLLRRLAPPDSVYSARLLSSSGSAAQRETGVRIRARLYLMSWVGAAAAVSHWCFWDVTTVSILRPIDVEPVITRLYNEMHYGRTEILILMSALSMLTIPICAGLALLVLRLASGIRRSRRRTHHQGDSIRSTI